MANKSIIKFPSFFIREKRKELELSRDQVRNVLGVSDWAYQKLEQRGEIPEKHIPALAEALNVSQTTLWIKKLAPVVHKIFSISEKDFEDFVTTHSKR